MLAGNEPNRARIVELKGQLKASDVSNTVRSKYVLWGMAAISVERYPLCWAPSAPVGRVVGTRALVAQVRLVIPAMMAGQTAYGFVASGQKNGGVVIDLTDDDSTNITTGTTRNHRTTTTNVSSCGLSSWKDRGRTARSRTKRDANPRAQKATANRGRSRPCANRRTGNTAASP
jgi:hypothetical protein